MASLQPHHHFRSWLLPKPSPHPLIASTDILQQNYRLLCTACRFPGLMIVALRTTLIRNCWSTSERTTNPLYPATRMHRRPSRLRISSLLTFVRTFTMSAVFWYHFSDSLFPLFHSALGFIRIPREQWHAINSSFSTLLTDVHITAIALYGSSKPGDSSLLEHLTEVTLAADPPPGAADQLPPGTKKGDRIGMIDLDVSFWNEYGQVTKQLVYGRTTWKDFDFSAFDPPKWCGGERIPFCCPKGFPGREGRLE